MNYLNESSNVSLMFTIVSFRAGTDQFTTMYTVMTSQISCSKLVVHYHSGQTLLTNQLTSRQPPSGRETGLRKIFSLVCKQLLGIVYVVVCFHLIKKQDNVNCLWTFCCSLAHNTNKQIKTITLCSRLVTNQML